MSDQEVQTRKGDTLTFTYDTLNRLSTKAAPSESTVTYAYDLMGRPIGVTDTSAAIASAATSASYATSYSYDPLNRMIAASWTPAAAQTTPTASTVSFTHAYDANNRRIGQAANDNSWLLYPAGASSTAYTANNLNQYTAVGTASPAYDGDGNLTSDGTLTYGYDAENRLLSIKQGATTLGAYAYDAQGRRKSKTAGGATTIFVTDADNREVLEYDGTSGAVQRWYAYGPGPNAVLNQMNVAAGTRATLIPDIQGSVIGSLDSGGTITKIGYQPFGENPGLTSGGFRYTGQRQDPETAGSTSQPSGLYYYRSRMYSPGWGRFLQPDAGGYAGGLNLYGYVGNDPLDLIDQYGRAPDNPDGTYGDDHSNLTVDNGTVVLTAPRLPAYAAGGSAPTDPSTWDPAQLSANSTRMGLDEVSNQTLMGMIGAPAAGVALGTCVVTCPFVTAGATETAGETYSAIGSTGRVGEAALEKLGGQSQAYLRSNLGARYVDQLVNGAANEAKVGYQALTSGNRLQILKDVDLIQSGQINSSTWHFFTSPVTGAGGPSAPLADFLIQNGIKIVVH